MSKKDNHRKGVITEYKAALWYTERGHMISFPMMTQSAYDFIAEKDGKCLRVQVKTPTWNTSGHTYAYLQCRLGVDQRVSKATNSSKGCRYIDSCDEIIFITQDTNEVWRFPVNVLEKTSNVCLKSTNPNPKKNTKDYNPDDYKEQ